MGILICTGVTSLDGYVNDEHGEFGWAAPSDEEHAFVNDLERSIGTYLYGRRLYDTMLYWETPGPEAAESAVMSDYAELWQAAEKIVYSTTLDAVATEHTRIERVFDPAVVRDLVSRSDRDVSIGGPHLAAHAFAAGLVDEVRMLLHPVVVGGGTRLLPEHQRLDLELVQQHVFENGVVFLRYRVVH